MKIIQIIAIAALSSLAFTAQAYTGKEACERNINDYDDVHCTYLKGLNNPYEGRFIKHQSDDFSYVSCVHGNDFEFDVYQEMAPYMAGNQTIQYSICTDPSGALCEAVGTDAFTITQDSEKDGLPHYVAQPRIYAIDVSAVVTKYPVCFSLKPKQEVLLPFTTKR